MVLVYILRFGSSGQIFKDSCVESMKRTEVVVVIVFLVLQDVQTWFSGGNFVFRISFNFSEFISEVTRFLGGMSSECIFQVRGLGVDDLNFFDISFGIILVLLILQSFRSYCDRGREGREIVEGRFLICSSISFIWEIL